MDLNKLEVGRWISSSVATVSEWKKLVSPVKGRRTSMFAIRFALTLLVCSLFLAFNYPNRLVTNPMDHRQSWFPSVFRDSSRSRSFFKFIFPDSDSSSDETYKSIIDNADEMSDSRANSTQGIINNGSVPMIDNAGQMPDSRANSTHGIHNTGYVPVNSAGIDGLNKTTVSVNSTWETVSAGLDNKPPGVVSSNDSSQSPKSMPNSCVSAIDLAPSGTELKTQGIINGSTKSVEKKCDIFFGRWVPDGIGTLYPPGSCPHIDESFNCFLNRRPEATRSGLL